MVTYELSFSDQIMATFDTGLPLYTFRLKEEINVDALKEAVNEALLKHPLYRSRLVFEDGLYKYVHNELDPLISLAKWEDSLEYGTEKNNFYPWIIIAEEDMIHFTTAHSLSDGGGSSRFIKSVLISYLEKMGRVFPPDIDITIEDSQRTTELSGDKHLNFDNEAILVPKEKEVLDMSLDMYENDINKVSAYNISIKESDIKKLTKESQTTTFAALAAILAISYDKMLGLEAGIIKVEVPFDQRRFWNSITDHNFTFMTKLYYDIAKLRGKDINLVQTDFRSQLDIYMDSTNQINKFNQDYNMRKMLKENPALLCQMAKSVKDRMFAPKASIILTHLGNLRYPKELLSEILDFRLTGRLMPGSMMAAIGFLYKDTITLNMVQATKGDIYIEKLREMMDENNIPYVCEKIKPHGIIDLVVPRCI